MDFSLRRLAEPNAAYRTAPRQPAGKVERSSYPLLITSAA